MSFKNPDKLKKKKNVVKKVSKKGKTTNENTSVKKSNEKSK